MRSKAMKNLQTTYPNKFHYSGIEFNCNSGIMQQIADELKGQTGVACNLPQLTELFVKSIEVAFR